MSKNLNYKQAANVERRTWDREAYEAKARDRAAGRKHDDEQLGEKRPRDDEDEKQEFIPAAPGAAGPERSKRAFLKARSDKVEIDSKIGSTEIVSAEAVATTSSASDGVESIKDGVTKSGIGWHCKVCDCFLKDSLTYLDHINGRKHQRNLGYSMRVEKSTKDQVVARLAQLAKEGESKSDTNDTAVETNYHDVVKAKDEEESRRKEERARKRQERKKKQQEPEEEDAAEAEIHPDMAAMMGFSGFGGGNKNR